jgi:hypothetical protein
VPILLHPRDAHITDRPARTTTSQFAFVALIVCCIDMPEIPLQGLGCGCATSDIIANAALDRRAYLSDYKTVNSFPRITFAAA